MAQTKRKRRSTKHRGNAAGMVEARGRTGRKPTSEELKASARSSAAQKRIDRLDKPPTWSSAANRAAIAALIFGVLLVVAFGQSLSQSMAMTGFVLLLYIPLGYYTDQFIYKRRQAKKART